SHFLQSVPNHTLSLDFLSPTPTLFFSLSLSPQPMAPRKVISKKRAHGESSTEPPSYDKTNFRSLTDEEAFLKAFSTQKVEIMKRIDVEFCRNENFPLIPVLEHINLLDFCTFNEPHYPQLIQIFYSNLQTIPNDELILNTYVKGSGF